MKAQLDGEEITAAQWNGTKLYNEYRRILKETTNKPAKKIEFSIYLCWDGFGMNLGVKPIN